MLPVRARYAISRFAHVIFRRSRRRPGAQSVSRDEPARRISVRTLYGAKIKRTGCAKLEQHHHRPYAIRGRRRRSLRWYVLILTCFIYAINIADRYVVSTVLEPIRLELHLNDKGVAFLTGTPLAIFYVAFGIPISWCADRMNRRNILAISLIVWSAFTVLCGRSRNYLEFLLGRIGVGVGEAGGTPPSTAIVSDYFPADRRPMAMTVLALGAPIGAFLGANFAGKVAHLYSWRAAFIALGVPGLVMGILVYLTVREPVRGRLDGVLDELRAVAAGSRSSFCGNKRRPFTW